MWLVRGTDQFFNRRATHILRLEGADWNDGLDNGAGIHGESVALRHFTAGTCQN